MPNKNVDRTKTAITEPVDGKPWFANKALAPERRADQIYRRLRRAILTGDILARTRLVETDVATMLGASRTPVREAISRLTSDRLVTPLANGGVEVVDTASELDEIYCIREALEGTAARLAAARIKTEELERLETLLQQSSRLSHDDYQTRVTLNNEFHRIVFNASRSDRLIEMINGFREFFLSERVLGKYNKRDTETALKHHSEIIAALRARDGKRAEKLTRRHLEHGRQRAKSAPDS